MKSINYPLIVYDNTINNLPDNFTSTKTQKSPRNANKNGVPPYCKPKTFKNGTKENIFCFVVKNVVSGNQIKPHHQKIFFVPFPSSIVKKDKKLVKKECSTL